MAVVCQRGWGSLGAVMAHLAGLSEGESPLWPGPEEGGVARAMGLLPERPRALMGAPF